MLVIGILLLLLMLLCTGMPLVFAMGVSSMVYMLFGDIDFAMMTQRMTTSVNSFVILAIPFFYFAGELMNACKLTDRIIGLAKALVGHIHGGLAQVNIVASMIFAGLSGSATADTAALGSVLIPGMKREGYPAAFSAAVTVASATVGPIIPPSIAMIIYGALADVSIGRLLLAGILPGLTIILSQMAFTWFLAKKYNFPRSKRASMGEVGHAVSRGSSAILFPIIIVVGIMSGVCTPTEAAALAVLYGLALGVVVYRNVGMGEFWKTTQRVISGSVRILIIIAAASCFSWIMLREQVPQAMASSLLSVTHDQTVLLFLLTIFLLLVGLFMVASSAEVVLAPLLVPVVTQFGIDPVHFGVLMVFALIVGGSTPPVGVLLFIAQDIADVPYGQVVRAMLPYYLPLAIALILIIIFPEISLWIPNLVFGVEVHP